MCMVFDVDHAAFRRQSGWRVNNPDVYGALTAPRLRQGVIVKGIMSSTIVCMASAIVRGARGFLACLFAR
jgi:hypothetical protein